MKHMKVLLLPEGLKKVRELRIPLFLIKMLTPISLIFIGLSGFFIVDYLDLRKMRTHYSELESQNAGLKGEARILMSSLTDTKKSLGKVQDYMSKLSDLTQFKVDQVSKRTGIGPLSPEEYSQAIRQNTSDNTRKLAFGLNMDKLIFRPIFHELGSINDQANKQAMELQQLLASLSQRKSLLNSIPSVNPVDGWITSGFGKRISPFTGERTMHRGLDVAAPIGTPILAPADGVVIFTGNKSGFGNFIMIAHGYGIISRFGHNAQNVVYAGQKIKRGEQIATVGMTGRTTGPHLHYEIWLNGKAVNPKKFILNIN